MMVLRPSLWLLLGLASGSHVTPLCDVALSASCAARRADVGRCMQCVGSHQHSLRTANCSTTDVDAFCRPAWKLTWSDEFGGGSLDSAKWTAADNSTHSWPYAWQPGSELELYTSDSVVVQNGSLVLRTRRDPAKCASYGGHNGRNITSGWVDSKGKFSQAFGRFEIRARLPDPASAEIWPALWMMPEPELTSPPHLCWPAGGEIDIMELWGGHPVGRPQVSSTLHYTAHGGAAPKSCGGEADQAHGHIGSLKGDSWSTDFHVWELIWSANALVFSVDGKTIGSVSSSDVLVPRTPFYLIFNTAVCGAKYCQVKHPYVLVPTPVAMEIDYVRVYSAQ
jgi:beta-glucanase (GH16 family)